jgi:hypothetical protein
MRRHGAQLMWIKTKFEVTAMLPIMRWGATGLRDSRRNDANALNRAGVEFIDENGGGPGVLLRWR